MVRKFRIRRSPAGSFYGGVVGLWFIGLGLFVALPANRTIGVLLTMAGAALAVIKFYNAFSERGISSEIIVETDDEDDKADGNDLSGTRSTESRLRRLDQLLEKSVVTPVEHESRRAEILREI